MPKPGVICLAIIGVIFLIAIIVKVWWCAFADFYGPEDED